MTPPDDVSERTSIEELRERAKRAPRTWRPPDWLRRVLSFEELSEINEATPTCWVRMFLWWRSGSEDGWNVSRMCVRDAEKTGRCYCGRYGPDEAREAMLRWSGEGKRDWSRSQAEGPSPCVRCYDRDADADDGYCSECRPEEVPA